MLTRAGFTPERIEQFLSLNGAEGFADVDASAFPTGYISSRNDDWPTFSAILIAGLERWKASQPAAAATLARDEATHSPDFRSVNWFGELFSFTPNQAACIQVLWEAWQNRAPDVGGETLLQAADASTQRIDVVFRHHQAWGTMIVQGGTRGSYRLAQMAANSAKAGKRKRKSARTRK